MIRFATYAFFGVGVVLVVVTLVLLCILALGVAILDLSIYLWRRRRTQSAERLRAQVDVVPAEVEMCPWPWCCLKLLAELGHDFLGADADWTPRQLTTSFVFIVLGAQAFVGGILDVFLLPWQLWMRHKWRARQRKRIREARMLAAIKRSNGVAADASWHSARISGIRVLEARYSPYVLSLAEIVRMHQKRGCA